MRASANDTVVIGKVLGPLGVRGYVKVYSYTDPPENIFSYQPWLLSLSGRWRSRELEQGRRHGKGLIAKLGGCEDREAAAMLAGAEIAIARNQLDSLAAGEYYWADLIGLRVRGPGGEDFGTVARLLETGANDVLVVRGDRERLIPFVPGSIVTAIDLERGELTVDWDPGF